MPRVELIFDPDCPHVEATREQLRRAFRELDQAPDWQEWNRKATGSPGYTRFYGSPTILVDGQDVAGDIPSDAADCCRIYRTGEDSLRGEPPLDAILAALRDRGRHHGTKGLRSWLAVLPAVGVALLPKVTCPACWPVYAGLLSAIGLGFLTQTAYLLPLTVAFLIVAVAALGFRARRRRGWGPFVMGATAALIVVTGKFLFESDPAMSGGVALLIGASAWNTWPRHTRPAHCSACPVPEEQSPVPRVSLTTQGGIHHDC
jgi:mercuric ion transport protein